MTDSHECKGCQKRSRLGCCEETAWFGSNKKGQQAGQGQDPCKEEQIKDKALGQNESRSDDGDEEKDGSAEPLFKHDQERAQ